MGLHRNLRQDPFAHWSAAKKQRKICNYHNSISMTYSNSIIHTLAWHPSFWIPVIIQNCELYLAVWTIYEQILPIYIGNMCKRFTEYLYEIEKVRARQIQNYTMRCIRVQLRILNGELNSTDTIHWIDTIEEQICSYIKLCKLCVGGCVCGCDLPTMISEIFVYLQWRRASTHVVHCHHDVIEHNSKGFNITISGQTLNTIIYCSYEKQYGLIDLTMPWQEPLGKWQNSCARSIHVCVSVCVLELAHGSTQIKMQIQWKIYS